MHVTSIRWPDSLWEAVQDEAAREGISASQFVREAALMRVWFERGRSGGPFADQIGELLLLARERGEP